MKKIFPIVVIMIFFCFLLFTGCTGIESGIFEGKENETYNTSIALNANEYSYVLNKETTTVCGILASQMIMLHNVTVNEVSFDRAEASVEGAKQTITECLKVIESTRPAVTYEDDRKNIIDSFENVLTILDEYEILLKQEYTESESIKDISYRLKTEFTLLTAYQNIYYN